MFGLGLSFAGSFGLMPSGLGSMSGSTPAPTTSPLMAGAWFSRPRGHQCVLSHQEEKDGTRLNVFA